MTWPAPKYNSACAPHLPAPAAPAAVLLGWENKLPKDAAAALAALVGPDGKQVQPTPDRQAQARAQAKELAQRLEAQLGRVLRENAAVLARGEEPSWGGDPPEVAGAGAGDVDSCAADALPAGGDADADGDSSSIGSSITTGEEPGQLRDRMLRTPAVRKALRSVFLSTFLRLVVQHAPLDQADVDD